MGIVAVVELNTFSISARCARTGMLGVAVSTALPAVGGLCLFARAKVGAIATQSWVNPYLGIDGLALLQQGLPAEQVLERLVANDPGQSMRQLGIVDAGGQAAAFTGADCVGWAGHEVGEGFSAQGNMLTGPATIAAMAEVVATTADLPLSERLMLALEVGQRMGGDKRGKQSAALKIVHREDYPWLDLRVDDHPEPVAELRRILNLAEQQLVPVMDGMPSRENPLGSISAGMVTMLMTPPSLRPQGLARAADAKAGRGAARSKRAS